MGCKPLGNTDNSEGLAELGLWEGIIEASGFSSRAVGCGLIGSVAFYVPAERVGIYMASLPDRVGLLNIEAVCGPVDSP
jgi:hypothetical protein